jgi:epoxyqueuosine reductase
MGGSADVPALTPSRERILRAGASLGFVRPRVARIGPTGRDAFYAQWLADGRAADMRFLQHHVKARLDPRTRYPWARSVVSAFYPYAPPPPPQVDWRAALRGRIAAYALGRDYHAEMRERLDRWARAVGDILPGVRAAGFVDTAAVFEHEWAARAGVGWTGKHTLTLSEDAGSYAFLGELLVGADIEPDPPAIDRCGTCTRCIDACPTGAIEPGYRLEPRRCISYLTIEHKGVIAPDLRPALGEWLFGCDLCQVACPWNRDASSPPDERLAPSLGQILELDASGFQNRYGDSAVAHAGRVRLARNAAVVLGNTGNPAAVPALARALAGHDAALVRGHAAWALGRLREVSGAAARIALERARTSDPEETVRAEARDALGG